MSHFSIILCPFLVFIHTPLNLIIQCPCSPRKDRYEWTTPIEDSPSSVWFLCRDHHQKRASKLECSLLIKTDVFLHHLPEFAQIHVNIHSFSKQFLSTYYVLGMVSYTRNQIGCKILPLSQRVHGAVEERESMGNASMTRIYLSYSIHLTEPCLGLLFY